jgi:hypothetical protein
MQGGRLTRWLAHPIRLVMVACALCWLMADTATSVRMVGTLSFVPLAGLALSALLLVVLVSRVADALVERGALPYLQHALQLGLLLALDLVLLALVLAAIGTPSLAMFPVRHGDRVFGVLIALPLRAGAWIGSVAPVVGAIAAIAVTIAVLGRRGRWIAAVGGFFTKTVWSLLLAYVLGVSALTVGAAGRWLGAPAREVVVTVHDVRPVLAPLGVVSVVVDSWRTTGARERLMLMRGMDGPAVTRVQPGGHLRLDTRQGLLGLPVVDHVRIDAEGALPELVALVPSAEWPRKQIMSDLTRRGRWSELVAQAREYRRHHPADRTTIAGVISALREAGLMEPAKSLEAELAEAPVEGRAL